MQRKFISTFPSDTERCRLGAGSDWIGHRERPRAEGLNMQFYRRSSRGALQVVRNGCSEHSLTDPTTELPSGQKQPRSARLVSFAFPEYTPASGGYRSGSSKARRRIATTHIPTRRASITFTGGMLLVTWPSSGDQSHQPFRRVRCLLFAAGAALGNGAFSISGAPHWILPTEDQG
jgi:hypothetical protein